MTTTTHWSLAESELVRARIRELVETGTSYSAGRREDLRYLAACWCVLLRTLTE
jgi:hypothetical protein